MERVGLRLQLRKQQAEAGDIVLLYGDESEALTHPYLARAWAKVAADLRVPAPGQAKKVAILGSLDHVTRQLIVHTSPTKRSSDFVAHLDQLDRLYGPRPGQPVKPVVLVEDNGPIHTSRLSLAALAARAHWLTVEWLPKYAPELNDIELVWHDLKAHHLAHQTFADSDALDRAIHQAVDDLNDERIALPLAEPRISAQLYHVFSLSLRDVELLLAERGIVVSYESVRRWCKKFGQSFARCLRRRRPPPGDKWHLDEVFIRIQGVQHYLWRAVDQDGIVLDILVQERRDAKAAKRFFKRLLKGLPYVPRVIVTDKLRSCGVAQRHLLPGVEHRQSRYLNNRAENSHRPPRHRERQMQRFKSPEQALDFLFAHAFIPGHFHPRRDLMAATAYRAVRSTAFNVWQQAACAQHPP